MSDIRKVEILIDGIWTEKKMIDIKGGEMFRVTEPDGTPVLFCECYELCAASDGFIREDGIGSVYVYRIK